MNNIMELEHIKKKSMDYFKSDELNLNLTNSEFITNNLKKKDNIKK